MNTKINKTQPIDEIINTIDIDLQYAKEDLKRFIIGLITCEYTPDRMKAEIDYKIEVITSKAYSLGALRVVAKSADQARILIEGRIA